MNDADLQKLRAVTDAATPEPWLLSETSECVETTQLGGDGIVYGGYLWRPDFDDDDSSEARRDYLRRDGAFIAAARSAIPALLDEVEGARAPEAHWECQQKIDTLEEQLAETRKGLTEALDLFDAVWCPDHGHAPKPEQLARAEELRKLVSR